ncbi:zinc finger MYM-type protein 5-like [Papaver somniferum]|uniref:zinc finger MYM-type protein 5-like n=1 Tax=Papaver somniferum TaxID=3469 RepID=UPI000E6F7250|nr:zinc finger MYM-type protein 5-like [Papaver somniferum]
MGPFRRTKCKSGAAKKKAKARAEKLKNSLRGAMNMYLVSNNNIDEETMIDIDEEWENLVTEMETNGDLLLNDENAHRQNEEPMGQEFSPPNANDIQQDEEPSGEELSSSDTNEVVQNEVEHEEYGPVNIYDPGNWGNNINRSLRDILVKKGPIREIDKNFRFPIDKYNRCFNDDHYIWKMENGECWDRKWLVYSSTVDRVFCFFCKLFKQDGKKVSVGYKGF